MMKNLVLLVMPDCYVDFCEMSFNLTEGFCGYCHWASKFEISGVISGYSTQDFDG